jgi:hypothetical protein
MIRLRKLRELRLREPAPDGRRHLSAASGLVCAGEYLYVVADDELHLGVFPARGATPGELLRLFPGELPAGHAARKAAKPDLEALAMLPDGALLALGSAATPRRERGAVLPLERNGEIAGPPRILDLARLAAALRVALGDVNIEGAVAAGDRLLLLQRGHRHARNALVGASLDAVLGRAEPRLVVRDVSLGNLDGIPLGFTDGALLPDGTLAFSAVAEDTASSYDDGPCTGAALGILSPEGEVLQLERLATPAKIEGIAVLAAGAALDLLLVTDADDATIPARLCAARVTRTAARRRGADFTPRDR